MMRLFQSFLFRFNGLDSLILHPTLFLTIRDSSPPPYSPPLTTPDIFEILLTVPNNRISIPIKTVLDSKTASLIFSLLPLRCCIDDKFTLFLHLKLTIP